MCVRKVGRNATQHVRPQSWTKCTIGMSLKIESSFEISFFLVHNFGHRTSSANFSTQPTQFARPLTHWRVRPNTIFIFHDFLFSGISCFFTSGIQGCHQTVFWTFGSSNDSFQRLATSRFSSREQKVSLLWNFHYHGCILVVVCSFGLRPQCRTLWTHSWTSRNASPCKFSSLARTHGHRQCSEQDSPLARSSPTVVPDPSSLW